MMEIVLRNGIKLPGIGLGTWQITDRALMCKIIVAAVQNGYRLIDTAAAYSNEIAIAKAFVAGGIRREQVLLSDKVWNTSRGFQKVQDACRRSLKKMKTDYFDLYLVHWPASIRLYPDWKEINAETWRGMEQLNKDGLVRAIGVCNFKARHLRTLRQTAEILPFVDQMEIHPGLLQQETVSCCRDMGIAVEAASPLGSGQILTNETLGGIAHVHGKSPAQICLRWLLQKGIIAIPKTTNESRLKMNMDLSGFELSDDQMAQIDHIPYCGGSWTDPDEVTEFGSYDT